MDFNLYGTESYAITDVPIINDTSFIPRGTIFIVADSCILNPNVGLIKCRELMGMKFVYRWEYLLLLEV